MPMSDHVYPEQKCIAISVIVRLDTDGDWTALDVSFHGLPSVRLYPQENINTPGEALDWALQRASQKALAL